MKSNKKNCLIIIIIFIGFLLRLYNLSYQNIWLDEAFSIYHSQQSLAHILDLKDNTPPLYYLLLNGWIQITGSSELSARLLSVFFGTISIFIIYLLGSLIFNKKAGIYSAFLLAISPVHIYYSQEARTYSLLFLLTLLSMYFYVKQRDGSSKKSIFGYLVSSVLLIYSHLYGILILLAQNFHQFSIYNFKYSRKLKFWISLQIIIIILYIPWLLQLFEIISNKTYLWIPRPSAAVLFPLIYKFSAGEVFSFFGLFLTLVYVFLFSKYPFKSVKKETVILFSWMVIPIIVPFTYSLIFTPMFTIKYALIASLPLYIVISYVLSNMNNFGKISVVLVFIVLSGFTLYIQQNTVTKDSWKEVSEFIQSNIQETEKIIIMNSYEIMPFSYYYSPNCFNNVNIDECSYTEGIYPLNSIEQIRKIKEERIWLILSSSQHIKNMQEISSLIYDTYDVVKSKEYLLNQNSAFFNRFYQFLDERNLLVRKFNKIEVKYLIKKNK